MMQKTGDLEFTEKGQRKVGSNPMVGAVVVKNGLNAGKGDHQVFGGTYAEVFVGKKQKNKTAVGRITTRPTA